MNRKPLFDAVRRLLGRRFRPDEVTALDRALDATADETIAPVPRSVSATGRAMICAFEGCARACGDGLFAAYPDPGTGGAPWTIGWGATGRGIGPETRWTRAECDARLDTDIARHAGDVERAVAGAATSQNQFDALVSFHFNTGAIARATLTRLHVAGDFAGAQREFARWNHAGGRVLLGLTRRRAGEAALYAK